MSNSPLTKKIEDPIVINLKPPPVIDKQTVELQNISLKSTSPVIEEKTDKLHAAKKPNVSTDIDVDDTSTSSD